MKMPIRITLILTMSAPAWVFSQAEATLLSAAPSIGCSSSPAQAAQSMFLTKAAPTVRNGYRVQDMIVDPVLHKAWIRVANCEDPRRPLTLVPIEAKIAGSGDGAITQSPEIEQNATTLQTVRKKPPVLVERNAPVEVLVLSSWAHMTMQGRAVNSAAAGEPVDVLLTGEVEPGQQPRHITGLAATAHRVEVER